MKNRLLCIVGPTASGKTSLSVAMALAYGTEIISADSMQIYKHMDIGTAKPSINERQGVAHHMIDICQPNENFSVARYVTLADQCAQSILKRGMTPIVAGGTGLYLDSLITCSTFSGNEVDLDLRNELNLLAAQKGNGAVHQRLALVDSRGAARLHPNNLKRIIRALEVYYQTGMTIDELNEKNRRVEPKYDAIKIGICPESREILYGRIDQRVDSMLKNGLLEEIEDLLGKNLLIGTAAQAIGYKEYIPYFEGTSTLDECTSVLKIRSKNYAKRQLTWLKRDKAICWMYYDNAITLEELVQRSTKKANDFGL